MASFDATLLDAREQPGIRTVALGLLADAESEFARMEASPAEPPDAVQHEGLERPAADEVLHDFRVAVRRLRSWLRAHREALGRSVPRAVSRSLRAVAQSTNARRDAEVFAAWLDTVAPAVDDLARPGVEKVRADVHARSEAGAGLPVDAAREYAGAREALAEALPLFEVTHHLTEGPRDASFAAALAAGVRRQAMALRRRLERIDGPADVVGIHAARIAGKRLRYLLEPVALHLVMGRDIITRLKALQDALGDLHDAHLWLDDLRQRLERIASEESRRRTDVAEGADAEGPDLRTGLHALVDALRERVRAGHAAFEATWDAPAREAFLAEVEHAAAALDHHGIGGVEIERKYLLTAMPAHHPPGEVTQIEQGYLPGEVLVERLRRVRRPDGDRHFRTVKSGTGIARLELEEEVPRELFDAMWPLTAGRRVTKRRHAIPDGGLVWELDEFTDRDLVLAEVELAHVDEDVVVPDWLVPCVVREVTGEPAYVNANLAR